ncbi:hypothetical protein COP2_042612 [Malus domestica]
MENIVARHEFTPQTMSRTKTSYTERVMMVYYCYASAPKRVLKQSQKSMRGCAELISPEVKCGGCLDDTVIFGQNIEGLYRVRTRVHTMSDSWSYTAGPAESLHSVTKPWPFRGWAMYVIGKITPSSGAAKHAWILVATDYFTKWVEAKSYAKLTSKEVCDFVEEHIVTRFGVPEMIITDNGIIFTAERFREYTASLKIWLEQSTPYYPQVNGQAEASNKVLIGILEKIIKKRPDMWHLKLNEALWAYRTSLRSATGTTPYALTYGHDAVLLVELSINSLRIIEQSSLFSAEYNQSMRHELEDLEEAQLDAYNLLVAQK